MLTLYKEYIEDLANTRSTEEFYNSDFNHAKIVLANLFRIATEKVRVFCADMLSEVNADTDYLKEVKSFLERGGKIDILLHDYSENLKKTAIWKLLEEYVKLGQVRVCYNNDNGFKNKENKYVHFTVIDELAYRLEFDVANKQARGFFNNPEVASVLVESFDNAFNSKDIITV